MGGGSRQKRKKKSSSSTSGSCGSDTSFLATPNKKPKVAVKTPIFDENRDELNNKEGENNFTTKMSEENVFSPDSDHSQSLLTGAATTNEDLMRKLCANGSAVEKLSQVVDELKATLFVLNTENDNLKKEVAQMKNREEQLLTKLSEVKHTAELADRRCEDLSAYVRRNNIRIFGVSEDNPDREETTADCEKKVLGILKEKLKVNVTSSDIEALHRVGAKRANKGNVDGASKPRGIIVRFVSRRVRDSVLYARRNLRGTKMLIAEDLTPRTYALLCRTRDEKAVCDIAWTKNGKVWMKTQSGRIVPVESAADLSKHKR